MGAITLVCWTGIVSVLHRMLKIHVNHDSFRTSRALSISGHTEELLTSSIWTHPSRVLRLCHLKGGHGGWMKKIINVFLPPPSNIPSPGQQFHPNQAQLWKRSCFLFLRHRTVYQNLLEAFWRSFSMASPLSLKPQSFRPPGARQGLQESTETTNPWRLKASFFSLVMCNVLQVSKHIWKYYFVINKDL